MYFSIAALLGLAAIPSSIALPAADLAPKCSSSSGNNDGNVVVNGCTWGVFCNTNEYLQNPENSTSTSNIKTCIAACEAYNAIGDNECTAVTWVQNTQVCNFFQGTLQTYEGPGITYAGLRRCKS